MNKQTQDAHLVERAQAGDTEAFGELYERHLETIYHYVFYRVGYRREAEDLTEAAFLRAWQALDENPPRQVPFRVWIYRIAHNAVVDYYRTRKQQVGLEAAAHVPDPVEGPEVAVARRERVDNVRRALLQLKEDHQAVLTCRFIVGLSHAETAIIMTRSEVAIRALQYRAIGALRKILIMQGDRHE